MDSLTGQDVVDGNTAMTRAGFQHHAGALGLEVSGERRINFAGNDAAGEALERIDDPAADDSAIVDRRPLHSTMFCSTTPQLDDVPHSLRPSSLRRWPDAMLMP